MPTNPQFFTTSRKTHVNYEKVQGNLPQCSQNERSSQETLSDRDGTSSGHPPVQGKCETFFRFSDPEEAARLVLEEQEIIFLMQESKVNTLDHCIREFQRSSF